MRSKFAAIGLGTWISVEMLSGCYREHAQENDSDARTCTSLLCDSGIHTAPDARTSFDGDTGIEIDPNIDAGSFEPVDANTDTGCELAQAGAATPADDERADDLLGGTYHNCYAPLGLFDVYAETVVFSPTALLRGRVRGFSVDGTLVIDTEYSIEANVLRLVREGHELRYFLTFGTEHDFIRLSADDLSHALVRVD